MLTVRTVAGVREHLLPARREGRTIGLVPTMGALHEGHLSLIHAARAECDVVVVSLFVNPAQFDDAGDLAAYPRDEERDAGLAATAGADVLFAPTPEHVYPPGFASTVHVDGVTETLEGAHRGVAHFDGVATVVTKLLNMVGPDVAYFGQKDAQQALVIRRLVADLDLPVRVAVRPTVREADGLALSSRNVHLRGADRERALALRDGLRPPRRRWRPASATPAPCATPAWPRCAPAASSPSTSSSCPLTTSPPFDARRRRGAPRRGRAGRPHAPHRQHPPLSERKAPIPMSAHPNIHAPADASRLPVTLPRLLEKKRLGEPIVMVTAYDFPSARAAEAAGVDIVLVGDSGAMTVLGYPSTVAVELDELLVLARATRRGLHTPFLVGDLPFGSYEVSDEQAVRTAFRFVKEAGCDAVKLEGGGAVSVARAQAIVGVGIPVMGHVGLTPQTATALGGYRAQGRDAGTAERIARQALALQQAGCFSIVFEAIPAAVAAELMPRMDVPVIGIGAGPATDGQVLVFHDLLGIREGLGARFVKRYASLQDEMAAGVAAFADDVRTGRYPAPEHGYSIDDVELEGFREALAAT